MSNSPYYVYSHPEGISLNGRQYLVDEKGKIRSFKSSNNALNEINNLIDMDYNTPEDLEENEGIFISQKDELGPDITS